MAQPSAEHENNSIPGNCYSTVNTEHTHRSSEDLIARREPSITYHNNSNRIVDRTFIPCSNKMPDIFSLTIDFTR